MGKMKKILSAVLAMAMLMGMLVLPVSAEEATEAIHPGDEKAFTLEAKASKEFLFAPAAEGYYILCGDNRDRYTIDIRDDAGGNPEASVWQPDAGDRSGWVFYAQSGKNLHIDICNSTETTGSYRLTIVKAENYQSMTMNYVEYTGLVGGSVVLRVETTPDFAYERLSWSSSDPDVAAPGHGQGVSEQIACLAPGTATITATSENGLTATCQLTVRQMSAIGGDSFDVAIPGDEAQSFAFTPGKSGCYLFHWQTNIGEFTLEASEMGTEKYVDWAYWENGDYTRTGQVYELTAGQTYFLELTNWDVTDLAFSVSVTEMVPYERIWFDHVPTGYVGERVFLRASGSPDFAFENLSWTISNPEIAEKEFADGNFINLNCLKAGTTTITATAANGMSASCELVVKASTTLVPGETVELSIPYEKRASIEFTPAESGSYIFIYDIDAALYFDCFEKESETWIEENQWQSGSTSARGVSYDMEGGTAYTIYISNWAHAATVNISVRAVKADRLTDLCFEKDRYTCYVGSVMELWVTGAPEYGMEELVWSSSNDDIASVFGWGLNAAVEFYRTGTVTVTAATVDGRLKTSCTITVAEPVQLTMNRKQSVSISAGGFAMLQFTAPANGVYSLTFEGEALTGFAVFHEEGEYLEGEWWYRNGTAGVDYKMNAGETYQIYVYNDSPADGTAAVIMGQPVKATGMTIRDTGETVYVGWDICLEPIFEPVLAAEETVTWTSSNEQVVKFTETTTEEGSTCHRFRVVSAGTVILTATSASGLTASCKLTAVVPEALGLGVHTTPQISADDHVLYTFTPKTAGTYLVYDSDDGSRIVWASKNGNETIEEWRDGANVGCKITLAAGEAAWIEGVNHTEKAQAFTFRLEEMNHVHTLISVAETAPGYAQPGMKAHYVCVCGRLFADENGTTEVTTDELLIPQLIQVENGRTEISKEVIRSALQQLENGGEVRLPAAEAGRVESAVLPVEALTLVAEQDAALTLDMTAAAVTMDAAALAAVARKAGEHAAVTLKVAETPREELTQAQRDALKDKNVVTVISVQLLAGGQPIASTEDGGFGGGKAAVRIPFKPDPGTTAADYVVLFAADDGATAEIPIACEDGCLVMVLEHFSDYVIVKTVDTLLGDVNGDGKVNVTDLMRLANFFAGKASLG